MTVASQEKELQQLSSAKVLLAAKSGVEPGTSSTAVTVNNNTINKDTVFTLKRWNLVAMWSWDVECEVCAICRTPLMGSFASNALCFLTSIFLALN